MTVARLDSEMGMGELARWEKFERVEPFMGHRLEVLGGLICSTLANIHRGKSQTAYDTADFMPFYQMDRQAAERDRHIGKAVPVDEDDAQVMRLVASCGGRING